MLTLSYSRNTVYYERMYNEEEHGKWIPGYEGMYSVAKDGEVWSFKKGKAKTLGARRFSATGAFFVTLAKNNKRKLLRVERLMAATYLGLGVVEKGRVVVHRDGNKKNNNLDNLEVRGKSIDYYSESKHGRWIRGQEGRYSITKTGEVWTFLDRSPRKLKHLFSGFSRMNYPKVCLCYGKKHDRRQFFVHQLVTDTYLGPRPDGMVVCHNNGDPNDCRLSNLRYDTQKNNCQDTIRHGNSLKGEVNPAAILSNETVARIKMDLKRLEPLRRGDSRMLAMKYGVTDTTISSIKTGRNWSSVQAVITPSGV